MMLGLVFSFLGFFPWLVLQLGRLLVLLQAKVLVALRPAQWVVGPLSCIGRAHTILTVRLLRPLGNESAVQTVTRLLKGLDWAAASEAAAAQHQLTGGIMAIAKGRRPKHSKAALRRRGQLAAWTQRGVVGPVSGFRVTHAHEHGVVKAWYLTPHVKWVDVVELTLLPTPGMFGCECAWRFGRTDGQTFTWLGHPNRTQAATCSLKPILGRRASSRR